MIPACIFAANPKIKVTMQSSKCQTPKITKRQYKTLEQEQIISKTCHFNTYEAEKQQFMLVNRSNTIATRTKQKWGCGSSCGTRSHTLPCGHCDWSGDKTNHPLTLDECNWLCLVWHQIKMLSFHCRKGTVLAQRRNMFYIYSTNLWSDSLPSTWISLNRLKLGLHERLYWKYFFVRKTFKQIWKIIYFWLNTFTKRR